LLTIYKLHIVNASVTKAHDTNVIIIAATGAGVLQLSPPPRLVFDTIPLFMALSGHALTTRFEDEFETLPRRT
jgi:hypothetical protein